MEESVRNIISRINTWEELRNFRANATAKGRLTDEVVGALGKRMSEMGRALVAQHTGVDLSALNAAESKIVDAVAAYVSLKKEQGTHSEYTYRQIRNRGLVGAAEAAVCHTKPREGFQALAKEDLESISYEQIVLEHPEQFSPRAVWFARQTLGLGNETAHPPQVDEALSQQSKPVAWSRDELILALDLYIQNRAKPLQKGAPEIVELSSILNRLGKLLDQRSVDNYRNENGVYMKLMNFKSIDPLHVKEGKKGLNRNNKDEPIVWNMYAEDPVKLNAVANLIRAGIERQEDIGVLPEVEEIGIETAEEGRIVTRWHAYRERDRRIVDEAKKVFLKKHQRLFCEGCGFDFKKRYGAAGEGLIEVHHTKPVHTLQPGELTRIQDLALLCANCHRVVHSRRKWLTLGELREACAQGE